MQPLDDYFKKFMRPKTEDELFAISQPVAPAQHGLPEEPQKMEGLLGKAIEVQTYGTYLFKAIFDTLDGYIASRYREKTPFFKIAKQKFNENMQQAKALIENNADNKLRLLGHNALTLGLNFVFRPVGTTIRAAGATVSTVFGELSLLYTDANVAMSRLFGNEEAAKEWLMTRRELERFYTREQMVATSEENPMFGLGVLYDMALKAFFDFEPTIEIEWMDAHGRRQTERIRAELIKEYNQKIREAGGQVTYVGEDSALNRTSGWVRFFIDMADFGAVSSLSKAGVRAAAAATRGTVKGIGHGGAFILGKTGAIKATEALRKPIAHSISHLTAYVEKNVGAPISGISRRAAQIFSAADRRNRAGVEETKRVVEDVRRSILGEDNWVTKMIERDPQRFAERYGESTLFSVKKLRDWAKEELEKGTDRKELQEKLRNAEALSYSFLTGMPINYVSALATEAMGKTPDEIAKLLTKYDTAKVHPSLLALIVTDEDMLSRLSRVTAIADVPSDIREAVFNIALMRVDSSRPIALLDAVSRDAIGDVEQYLLPLGIPFNEAIERSVRQTMRSYSRAFQNKLVAAMHIIQHYGGSPIERKYLSQYVSLMFGMSDMTAQKAKNWLKRLGATEDVDDLTRSVAEDFVDLLERIEKGQGEELLNIIKDGSLAKFSDDIKNIEALIDDLNKAGFEEAKLPLIDCIGKNAGRLVATVGGLTGLSVLETVLRSGLDDGTKLNRSVFFEVEEKIRNGVRRHILENDMKEEDIPEQVWRWVNGDSYLKPTTALSTVINMAEAIGLDGSVVREVANLRNVVAQGLKNLWDDKAYLPIHIETPRLSFTSFSEVMTSLRAHLERLGRQEEASYVEWLAKQDAPLVMLHDHLLGREVPSVPMGDRRIFDNLLNTYADLYFKGKEMSLEERTHRTLWGLKQISSIYGGLISDTYSPLHTERLSEDLPYIGGKYVTPYLKQQIEFMRQGDNSVWRGFFDNLNTYFKHALVVWNPFAIIRDAVSNVVSMMYGLDIHPNQFYKVIAYYNKAYHSMRTNDEAWQRMRDLTPSTWGAVIHTHNIEAEVMERIMSTGFSQKALWWLGNLPLLKHMQNLRGYIEGVSKMAMFHAVRDEINRHVGNAKRYDVVFKEMTEKYGIHPNLFNIDPDALAVAVAEKYILDYQDVAPAIRFLRRYIGLFPFITYETKMANVLFGNFFGRGTFLYRFIRSIEETDKLISDDEGAEEALSRSLLPDRLRTNPLTLTWYDKETRTQKAFDLSYYVPFGVILPLQRILNEPIDPDTWFSLLKERMGSVIVPMVEILANREFFTGKPIYNPQATESQKATAILKYLGGEIPVPLLPTSVRKELLMTKEEREKRAEKTSRDWDLTQRLFNIYSIKVDEIKAKEYKDTIKRVNSLIRKALKEHNRLMEEGKQEQAKSVYRHYINEANRLRRRLDQMDNALYYLEDQKENSPILLEPAIGFNPFIDYNHEINLFTYIYDVMHSTGSLPQNTTKLDILDAVVRTAEQFMRNAIELLPYLEATEAATFGWRNAVLDTLFENIDAAEREPDGDHPIFPLIPLPEHALLGREAEYVNSITQRRRNPVLLTDMINDMVGSTEATGLPPTGAAGTAQPSLSDSALASLLSRFERAATPPQSMGGRGFTLKGRPPEW